MSFAASIHSKAIQICQQSLDMCAAAGSGHPTSAASISHLTAVLMYHTMRWNPQEPAAPTSDRLILSEGHAVPAVYSAYADLRGIVGKPGEERQLAPADLIQLRAADSVLDGHPNPMEGFPFFDAATGSLGQGLSVAVGVGLAARLDRIDRRVYCIIGDGESREGQIWEALDLMIDEHLTNVLPIFNCNQWGQSEKVSTQQGPEVLARKLEAYGFSVAIIDGHDPDAVKRAFDQFIANAKGDKPMAVVARTVKGWGSPTLHGPGWHGKPPVGEQLAQAKADLDARRVELVKTIGVDAIAIQPPMPPSGAPARTEARDTPTLTEAMKMYDMASVLSKGALATRRAYGIALRTLGKANPRIVVLDGDVKNSTFAETFAKDGALAERYFECKIAEQNMISVAAGLSAAGKVPFCSSFAKFLTRGYDQIEMAVNSGANIKMVGSHAGVTLAADGPSQMGLPDVAWFRSFSKVTDHRGNPACYVLQPSDAYAAYALTMVMAEYEGACYMRTLRSDTEFLYDDSTVFNLGGLEVLTEGRDLLIAASGYMVHEANKTLDELDKLGIDATLVDLYSLPFDSDKFLDLAQANNGMILTIEDNYGGGIGSAVADALTEDGGSFTLQQMCVTRIPKSSRSADEALAMCGLTHKDIVKRAARMLQVAGV